MLSASWGGAWTFTKQRFGDGFDTTFLVQISQFTGHVNQCFVAGAQRNGGPIPPG